MASKFSYRVVKYSTNYILCARVGSKLGKIIGEARFCLLPDGERVELKSFFADELHYDLLAPELLRQLERLVRFFHYSAVWLKALADQKNFFLARDYNLIVEHGGFCYMHKDLA